METINGVALKDWGLALVEIADFLYYEGPFLTLFEDKTGDYYFYKWADFDDLAHRWIVFPVSKTNLIAYLKKETTLRELLINSNSLYLVDLDADIKPVSTMITSPQFLPEDYLPMKNSWCNLKYLTEEAQEFAEKLLKSESETNEVYKPILEINKPTDISDSYPTKIGSNDDLTYENIDNVLNLELNVAA